MNQQQVRNRPKRLRIAASKQRGISKPLPYAGQYYHQHINTVTRPDGSSRDYISYGPIKSTDIPSPGPLKPLVDKLLSILVPKVA